MSHSADKKALLRSLLEEDLTDEQLEQLADEPNVFPPTRSADLLRGALRGRPPEKGGVLLCGAPAKVESVDRRLADEAEREGASKSPRLLEADWIATRRSIYYVTPRVFSVVWWDWGFIRSVSLGQRVWKFSGVLIDKQDDETIDLRTSTFGADLLMALANRFVLQEPRPAASD